MERPSKRSVELMDSIEEVHQGMCHVFQEAQLSMSGHRKLVIILKYLFIKAVDLDLLNEFSIAFTRLLNNILPLKRGDKTGDKIVHFCHGFVSAITKEEEDKDEDSDEEEETPEGEFIQSLIQHLLRGCKAKDKNVRFRVCQLLACLVFFLNELDHETFETLYTALEERVDDKDYHVRIQAIKAISRFQGFNLDDNFATQFGNEISSKSIKKIMIKALTSDETAEVRRAALLNYEKSPKNFSLMIERAKDSNSINRRLVYSDIAKSMGNFNKLKPKDIEKLLKWGLNDREDSVRDAAIKLLTNTWYESVEKDLLKLLGGLNVVDSLIAEKAVIAFFSNKPEILDSITLDQEFWSNLTTEEAFLTRTFYNYCTENKLFDLIDSNFPEALILASDLERYFDQRSDLMNENHLTIEQLKAYNDEITRLDDSIVNIEDEGYLLQIKDKQERRVIEVEESSLENYQGLLKVSECLKNDTSFDEFDPEESFVEEINNMSDDELEERLKEYRKAIQKQTKIIEKSKLNLKEIQKKFDKLQSALTNLCKERAKVVNSLNSYIKDVKVFKKELDDIEFIIEQYLLVATNYDFSDEMGRRKMLQLIRNKLSGKRLPESITSASLKVLRNISINEKDFVSMATEIITDIRDFVPMTAESGMDIRDFDDGDSFHSAHTSFHEPGGERSADSSDSRSGVDITSTPDSKRRKADTKLPSDDIVTHCLMITQHSLEIIEESLENNISLQSIYSGLVNYALSCDAKDSLHLLGLKCLGLFSLIDEEIARNACSTFLRKFRSHFGEHIKILSIKAIVDILSMYGIPIIEENKLHSYAKLLHNCLREYDYPKLQCVAAEGLCKLFLADIIGRGANVEEQDLLQSLVISYYNPKSQKNNELRQILAFCLPVYAFSHSKHQYRLATVSGDCLYRLSMIENQFSKDSKITPSSIVQELIYWCDPNNLINLDAKEVKKQTSHFMQTLIFLQAIEQDTSKAIKVAIMNHLGKMFITEQLDSESLKSLVESIDETKKVLEDKKDDPEFSIPKNSLKNFDTFASEIQITLEKSLERERRQEASSVGSSRVTSGANSMASIQVKSEQSSQSSSANTTLKEEDLEDLEKEMRSIEVNDVEQDEKNEGEEIDGQSAEENLQQEKKKRIEESLNDIDEILDKEDAVEYDVDISMDDI